MEMSVDRMLGIFGVLGIVIGVGVAIAMDPKIKGEMFFAIGCFIFSGIVLSLTLGIWAFNTDSAVKRILIAGPLFMITCASMVEASKWAEARYGRATAEKPSVDKNPPLGNEPKPKEKPPNVASRRPKIDAKPEKPSVIPQMQDGPNPYGQFDNQQFIELGQRILTKMRPFVGEVRKYNRSPVAPMSEAPNRIQYKQFMDMCFVDAERYRKAALGRLGSSGSPLAQHLYDAQKTGQGDASQMEDIYLDIESLVNQLSGKPKGQWALE